MTRDEKLSTMPNMDEELARADNGDTLTAFSHAAEHPHPTDAPLTVALVALWHDDRRLLLVFNRHRQCWELPGGMIDPGETPRQAAVRELHEETGIHLEALTFVGYARFKLGPEQRTEYAALYTAAATPNNDAPFTPTDEITATHWWDTTHPLPGALNPLDTHLAHQARQQPPRTSS